MNVKFMGKTLNIKNKSDERGEFYAEWNNYYIQILENDKSNYPNRDMWKEHRYFVIVVNPLGAMIVNGSEYPTKTECLQCAFDNINSDIKDMEKEVKKEDLLIKKYGETAINEIVETMKYVEEIKYWLNMITY